MVKSRMEGRVENKNRKHKILCVYIEYILNKVTGNSNIIHLPLSFRRQTQKSKKLDHLTLVYQDLKHPFVFSTNTATRTGYNIKPGKVKFTIKSGIPQHNIINNRSKKYQVRQMVRAYLYNDCTTMHQQSYKAKI